ncbi:MAG: WD40/YVTN/BNR-like repeat-containing protein, partial [Gemmatimonadales bacterium]
MQLTRLLVIGSLTAILAGPARAQTDRIEAAVSNLQWREIGPTIMGGRVANIAVVESNPAIFYVGTATGGVWRTTNNGASWEPLFDDQPASSIGDVTLSQANPNLIWVGTGEPQNRQSSPWGN